MIRKLRVFLFSKEKKNDRIKITITQRNGAANEKLIGSYFNEESYVEPIVRNVVNTRSNRNPNIH